MQKTNHINDLINRCLNKEQAAYYEVYNDYHKAMYNAAFRILHDTMEAEDVMQESFVKAFDKLDAFRRKSEYDMNVIPFGSWLKRIVINNSINQLRKNKKFVITDLEIVSDEVEVEPIDFSTDKVDVILNGLNNMNPRYKIALTLHLIEGYDYEEIGKIMEITYQNSRTLVSRAKAKLRQTISRTFNN